MKKESIIKIINKVSLAFNPEKQIILNNYLVTAMKNNNLQEFNNLLEIGADIKTIRNHLNFTTFCHKANKNEFEAVIENKRFNHNWSVEHKKEFLQTAMIIFINNDEYESFQYALNHKDFQNNLKVKDLYVLYRSACSKGNEKAVRLLMSLKEPILDSSSYYEGMRLTLTNNHEKIFYYLLMDKETKRFSKNHKGDTILMAECLLDADKYQKYLNVLIHDYSIKITPNLKYLLDQPKNINVKNLFKMRNLNKKLKTSLVMTSDAQKRGRVKI